MTLRLDFTALLRAQGERCQAENRARLQGGATLLGGAAAPKKAGGIAGIATGELLRELGRPENVRVGPTWFRVTVSQDRLVKWVVFNAGRRTGSTQPARPVSGITQERLAEIARAVARATREQLVRGLNGGNRS